MATRVALRRMAGLLGLAVLHACAAGPPRADAPRRKPCGGQPYMEVRNALDVPVAIYVASNRGIGGPLFLGTAGPGVTKLPLADSLHYWYAQRDDGAPVYKQDIAVHYDCDRYGFNQ